MWDDEVDPILLPLLQRAYLRRKQWEAKLQATEIVRALNYALGGGESSQATPKYSQVTPEQLMAKMGAKWH